MASKRRARAREIALQALYQYDVSRRRRDSGGDGSENVAELERFIRESASDEETRRYALGLFEGVVSGVEELDGRIGEVVAHWKLDRIAPVDRAILRLALYELLDLPDVPPKVVINEAIELAKKYSTAQSGPFVNGILDRLYRDLGLSGGGDPSGTEEADTAARSS